MPSAAATRVVQNGFAFYYATVGGKQLLRASAVTRRVEDPVAGFNRALSSPRAREIARYLDVRHMPVPTNIILSAQDSAKLRYRNGKLSWQEIEGAFLVLDGQHRLFAMQYAQNDYSLPVVIFEGLTQQQEVQLFIDINTNQVGVPPALLLDIKQLAGTESSEEERLRQIFDEVGRNPESPLRDLTSPAATRPGYVSRVTFNSALKRALSTGVLTGMSAPGDQAKLVVNYLQACDRILTAAGTRNNRLTKATVLQAFFEVMDLVVEETLERSKRVRADDLAATMAPLASIDFDSYIGSNRPSKGKLVADLRSLLIDTPALTPDML